MSNWPPKGVPIFYADDSCCIINGDCREILPLLPPVDLVLTDPPYGIERFRRGFGTTRFKGHGCETLGIVWDVRPSTDLLLAVIGQGAHAIIWGSNNFELPPSEYFLVWDKVQTVANFASAELAFTNLPVPAKVFRFPIQEHNQIAKSHPTQKPIALMRWCIGFAVAAKTVLDPFMGSGTTLRAAKDLGLRAIGIEINPAYCQIAVDRLKQEVFDFARQG